MEITWLAPTKTMNFFRKSVTFLENLRISCCFVIPALSYRRLSLVDLPIAGTVSVMVIDDAACLQMGINRNRSDVLEATPLHVFADAVRETVADRNRPHVMSLVQDGSVSGKAPDIVTEGAVFLAHPLAAFRGVFQKHQNQL